MNTQANHHLQMFRDRLQELKNHYWLYSYQNIFKDIPALKEAIKRKTYLTLPSLRDDCE